MANTPIRKYRLKEDTIADLEAIMLAYGLDSEAAAVRLAARLTAENAPKPKKKNSRKAKDSA